MHGEMPCIDHKHKNVERNTNAHASKDAELLSSQLLADALLLHFMCS